MMKDCPNIKERRKGISIVTHDKYFCFTHLDDSIPRTKVLLRENVLAIALEQVNGNQRVTRQGRRLSPGEVLEVSDVLWDPMGCLKIGVYKRHDSLMPFLQGLTKAFNAKKWKELASLLDGDAFLLRRQTLTHEQRCQEDLRWSLMGCLGTEPDVGKFEGIAAFMVKINDEGPGIIRTILNML